MSLPQPVPGLVIRYSFLWQAERQQGREDGLKDRPCAIVATAERSSDGKTYVIVLPVTHSVPSNPLEAIEIPWRVKKRLGLDDARSWIIPSEWNGFLWPGPDVRRVGDAGNESIAYGMFPPDLFKAVTILFARLRKEGTTRGGLRTE